MQIDDKDVELLGWFESLAVEIDHLNAPLDEEQGRISLPLNPKS